MHLLNRDLMDRGFDPGDEGQDGDRLLRRSVRQRRRSDSSHHVQEATGAMVIIVALTRGLVGKTEAEAAQYPASGFPKLPLIPSRQNRPSIGQHARPKIREGIKQGGNEHIAGDAADRIEVDVRHRVTRPGGPARRRGPPG